MPDPLDLIYPTMATGRGALAGAAPPATPAGEPVLYPSMRGQSAAPEGGAAAARTLSPEDAALAEIYPSMFEAPPSAQMTPTPGETPAAPAERASAQPVPTEIMPPEGMTVDPQAFQAFAKLATEAGVKPDVAQGFLKMHADALAAADYGRQEQAVQWAEQAKADPEIGGDRFDATVASARAVLGKYGDAELREALDRSGLGNHRGVIRLLARVASDLSKGEAGSALTSQPTSKQ